eukprot:31551-Pelagococcus_subviridis.AAC.6
MHSSTIAFATVSRAPIMLPEVSRQRMIGPHSAAGRISVPSVVTAGSSDHPTRSYDSSVRSIRRAKCSSRAGRDPFAMSAISDGSILEMSSLRQSPLVSSGSSALLRVVPYKNSSPVS